MIVNMQQPRDGNYLLIVDIDGTINEMGQKFDHARVRDIPPMEAAKEVLRAFLKRGSTIVYLTGRNEVEYKNETLDWLARHGFPGGEAVVFYSKKYGAWTWKSYISFKLSEIAKLERDNENQEILILDDNDSILRAAVKEGRKGFKIRSPRDWHELKARFINQASLF
ncbi:hypothetical protein GF325_13210 [Candidatus Bathyarchaeota archaeon]|nr:hypothetical protein [Candidatus Bathyarchaeota archaeon]